MSAKSLRFRTSDAQFGLFVEQMIMDIILRHCIDAGNVETGGILIGHYTERYDWAVVTDISGPPDDSRRGLTYFFRGIKGLKKLLNQVWNSKRDYFLGEWHFHPFARPEASQEDERQLREHSKNGLLMCPEPVLLIVGGNPQGIWKASAYVYPKGRMLLPMKEN